MNVVPIEDEAGELIDCANYCSDFCARTDSDYAGWCGESATGERDEWCESCGTRIDYDGYEGPCSGECLPVVVNVILDHTSERCEHGIPNYIRVEDDAR